MAKKKVKVLNAIVDGKGKGSVVEVDAKSAEMLIRNGYAEEVKEKKQAPKKEDGDEDK